MTQRKDYHIQVSLVAVQKGQFLLKGDFQERPDNRALSPDGGSGEARQ
jgi:hypothetical protein